MTTVVLSHGLVTALKTVKIRLTAVTFHAMTMMVVTVMVVVLLLLQQVVVVMRSFFQLQ